MKATCRTASCPSIGKHRQIVGFVASERQRGKTCSVDEIYPHVVCKGITNSLRFRHAGRGQYHSTALYFRIGVVPDAIHSRQQEPMRSSSVISEQSIVRIAKKDPDPSS